MTDQRGLKPYDVEISLPAGRDEVWASVTRPAVLRQWFGWDYDGLDAEIKQIFVDEATRAAPVRMGWADGSVLEVTGDDRSAEVRVHREGAGSSGPERYDAIEEAWRAFLPQLRFLLDCRPAGRRRTVYLTGEATAHDALALAVEPQPGHETAGAGGGWQRFGPRVAWTITGDGHLVVVAARAPLDTPGRSRTEITISTFGLPDESFDTLRKEWSTRWAAMATNARTTTAADPSPDT